MYMALEYNPYHSGAVPTELRMKIAGRDGHESAEHVVVTWDPGIRPVRVDDDTMLLNCEVKINNTWGMSAFVMVGAKITSLVTSNGAAVGMLSVKFSEKPGQRGFAIDGLPKEFASSDPDNETMPEYFCRVGLFAGEPRISGGMHMIPLDSDVNSDRILESLKCHDGTTPGAFCEKAMNDGAYGPYWLQCYLYACHDHADVDLSVWKSKDRHSEEGY